MRDRSGKEKKKQRRKHQLPSVFVCFLVCLSSRLAADSLSLSLSVSLSPTVSDHFSAELQIYFNPASLTDSSRRLCDSFLPLPLSLFLSLCGSESLLLSRPLPRKDCRPWPQPSKIKTAFIPLSSGARPLCLAASQPSRVLSIHVSFSLTFSPSPALSSSMSADVALVCFS